MPEDIFEILRIDFPEIFGKGTRKGGSFDLLRFCIKQDISVVSGSLNFPQEYISL
jgi:hypothetical protein